MCGSIIIIEGSLDTVSDIAYTEIWPWALTGGGHLQKINGSNLKGFD